MLDYRALSFTSAMVHVSISLLSGACNFLLTSEHSIRSKREETFALKRYEGRKMSTEAQVLHIYRIRGTGEPSIVKAKSTV